MANCLLLKTSKRGKEGEERQLNDYKLITNSYV